MVSDPAGGNGGKIIGYKPGTTEAHQHRQAMSVDGGRHAGRGPIDPDKVRLRTDVRREEAADRQPECDDKLTA